ncbi:MAG: carboxylating nicotinate-nucleotide diphosphorylase [Myxococcales bacterium]|nr:carboxylating nicotinate-nucleotide diphosphorylase [Myxococcales bacterium]
MNKTTHALIDLALSEDIGPGDVTAALVPAAQVGRAVLRAKSPLILSGSEVFAEVFQRVDRHTAIQFYAAEGEEVSPGTEVAVVDGPVRSLLQGERTALNFIQHLSGIATMTHKAVQLVLGTSTRVVDTRKTTPGLRVLEKAAVRHGGGTNHRFGLFDGVLIKDNHIDIMGGVAEAISAARQTAHHLLKIECEVRTLEEFETALTAGADVIMLDNMDKTTIKAAVERNRAMNSPAILEASGGVTIEQLASLAATGVDYISMGALTHSAPAADLSLKYLKSNESITY